MYTLQTLIIKLRVVELLLGKVDIRKEILPEIRTFRNEKEINLNIWKLNNKLLKICGSNKKLQEKLQNILSVNENTTCQHLQDAAKALFRGKLIPLSVYVRKEGSE